MNQPAFDLFSYPQTAGFKRRDTSRAAAESINREAPRIRDRIIALLTPAFQCTPDEAADILGLPILTVRPRFSELAADGVIIDSGYRRPNAISRKQAIVWRLA